MEHQTEFNYNGTRTIELGAKGPVTHLNTLTFFRLRKVYF